MIKIKLNALKFLQKKIEACDEFNRVNSSKLQENLMEFEKIEYQIKNETEKLNNMLIVNRDNLLKEVTHQRNEVINNSTQ